MASVDYSKYGAVPADVDYSKYGAVPVEHPKEDPNYSFGDYTKGAANTFVNTVEGARGAINNQVRNLANMISPKSMQAPLFPKVEGTGGGLGEFLGNTAGFIGGGSALNSAREAAESIPAVGQIAKILGGQGTSGVARRALGSSLYGAAEDPNNRGMGAAKGAALSTALDVAIPGAAKVVSGAVNAFKPQKYADEIFNTLSGGRNVEQTGKSLASDVNSAYKQRSQEASNLYNPVFEKVKGKSMLESMTPENSAYKSVPTDILHDYDRQLTKMHQNFTAEPTFQNAHELQSQLGSAIRKMDKADSKGTLSVGDRNIMQGYQEARQSLRTDMDNFLKNQDPALADQYSAANHHYLEHVVPYIENPKLAPIAKGEIENPRNIRNLFKNPEEGMEKIFEDLGPGAANKIVHVGLGPMPKNATPEQLTRSFDRLGTNGYGSYVTPELTNMMDILSSKLARRNFAQRAAGFLGGASLMGHASVPAELLGGAASAAVTPSIIRSLNKNMGTGSTTETIAKLIKDSYPSVKQSILANKLQ